MSQNKHIENIPEVGEPNTSAVYQTELKMPEAPYTFPRNPAGSMRAGKREVELAKGRRVGKELYEDELTEFYEREELRRTQDYSLQQQGAGTEFVRLRIAHLLGEKEQNAHLAQISDITTLAVRTMEADIDADTDATGNLVNEPEKSAKVWLSHYLPEVDLKDYDNRYARGKIQLEQLVISELSKVHIAASMFGGPSLIGNSAAIKTAFRSAFESPDGKEALWLMATTVKKAH